MQAKQSDHLQSGKRRQLPKDRKAQALISDITSRVIAMDFGNFTKNFAKAAGEAMNADMVLVSRIKSKELPVETYALYDRSGQMDDYTYSLKGTPCEIVFDTGQPLAVTKKVSVCFPMDKDIGDFGLHAYAAAPLFDSDGNAIGIIAAFWSSEQENLDTEKATLEYTAPLLAGSMLQLEAKARHELSVSGASSGVWYTDFEEGVEYYSSAARRILGYPDMPEKCQRNVAFKGLALGDRRIITAAFNAYRRGEAPFAVNFRMTPQHGAVRWLRITGKAKRNTNGKIIAIAGDITDISELVEAKRNAEAASRAKSNIIATMTNKIHTPMNDVIGLVGQLSEADIPEHYKRQADIIKKTSENMVSTLNDILDLSAT